MHSRETRFDDRVAAALDDVPIPPGLAERLLTALAASAEETVSAPAPDPRGIVSPAVSSPAVLRFPRAAARRRWLASAAACAATLLISATSWWLFHAPTNTATDLPTLAMRWSEQLSDAWQPMKLTPAGFTPPAAINSSPRGWQRAVLAGRQAVAFDYSRPGLHAIVFVLKMAGAALPPAPPPNPQLHTGGQSISAWQSRSGTCVLVVEGDERAYRSLIRSGGTPMA